MAFVPAALAVAGTLVSGLANFRQGQYQAAVAKQNAKIAQVNAERASEAGQLEQMRSDREYMAQEASALAAQSASGLDVLGGSQILTRKNIQRVRGEQATDIRKQALIEVGNFFQDQANFLGEARAAKTNAWMGLAATAFSAGSQIAKIPQVQKGFNSLIGGAKSKVGGSK